MENREFNSKDIILNIKDSTRSCAILAIKAEYCSNTFFINSCIEQRQFENVLNWLKHHERVEIELWNPTELTCSHGFGVFIRGYIEKDTADNDNIHVSWIISCEHFQMDSVNCIPKFDLVTVHLINNTNILLADNDLKEIAKPSLWKYELSPQLPPSYLFASELPESGHVDLLLYSDANCIKLITNEAIKKQLFSELTRKS